LEVEPVGKDKLYYQLFHRTCAAIYEAKRFGYKRAVMLVHSFAQLPPPPALPACFSDFSDFASAIGMPVAKPGTISAPKQLDHIEVRLAWVSDSKVQP
jgi:hypothetical protein